MKTGSQSTSGAGTEYTIDTGLKTIVNLIVFGSVDGMFSFWNNQKPTKYFYANAQYGNEASFPSTETHGTYLIYLKGITGGKFKIRMPYFDNESVTWIAYGEE